MQNRLVTLETTKAYQKAFNDQDVVSIAQLLDDENCIFSRQEQSTIVGKDNVLRRIRNLFWRAGEQHKSIRLVQAIIDLGSSKARPCLICLVNEIPVAVCVISCKINGKINAIAVLLNGSVVSLARHTEPLSQERDSDVKYKETRNDLVQVIKHYCTAFNKRNLKSLGDILDERETVFHRHDQEAIIGKTNILSHNQDLYRRIDKHGQQLFIIGAIIDYEDKKAWPCTLGILDGVPVSVGIVTLRNSKQISTIKVILDPEYVKRARPTEEIPTIEKPKITLDQILEREEWLKTRLKKIAFLMEKNGNLPHLVGKKIRVEQQLEKISQLKKKFQ